MLDETKDAEEKATKELDDAQKRLDAKVDEVRKRTDLDERRKEMEIAQPAAGGAEAAGGGQAEIEDGRRRDRAEQATMKQSVSSIKKNIRMPGGSLRRSRRRSWACTCSAPDGGQGRVS
jgi:hypothetical protein